MQLQDLIALADGRIINLIRWLQNKQLLSIGPLLCSSHGMNQQRQMTLLVRDDSVDGFVW